MIPLCSTISRLAWLFPMAVSGIQGAGVSKPPNKNAFHTYVCALFPTVSLANTSHMAKFRVPEYRKQWTRESGGSKLANILISLSPEWSKSR